MSAAQQQELLVNQLFTGPWPTVRPSDPELCIGLGMQLIMTAFKQVNVSRWPVAP